MDNWIKISSFLYSGISQSIKLYKSVPSLATEKSLKELKEAINIYNENCIVSGLYLSIGYNDLIEYLKTL